MHNSWASSVAILVVCVVTTVSGSTEARVGGIPDGGRNAQAQDEVCTAYDPKALTKTKSDRDIWTVGDSKKMSQRVIGESNADKFISLAKSYSRRCRIPGLAGRFVDYWDGRGVTDLPPKSASEDCLPYDPSNLTIVAADGNYRVGSGVLVLATFSRETNAQKMIQIAKVKQFRCFIGRDAENSGPDRLHYIVSYWR